MSLFIHRPDCGDYVVLFDSSADEAVTALKAPALRALAAELLEAAEWLETTR
jgi:hypothetical protein